MSGSRKSLQRAAQTFNPRAENSWSKDDTKFGQKMLEKMGWKKGEGIGRDGQGVTENIKIRWKLDSKGLGFSIKEDEWVAVEHDFSSLLSNLNKDCSSSRTKTTKLSLESTSSSSRSRVHYRKFIRGKDISKYSKKDLSGILGRNAEVGEEYNSNLSENQTDSGSAGTSKQLHDDEEFEDRVNGDSSFRNDSENVESNETPVSELRVPSVKKRKKTKVDSNEDDFNNSIQKVTENDLSHKKTNGSTKRKKSLITSDQLHVDEISEEIASDDAILRNGSENVESNETQASEEKRPSVKKQRKNKIVSNMDNFHDSVQEVPMIDLTDNKKSDRSAKRKKSLNTSDQLHVDDDKSVEIANDDLIPRNDCESVKSNKTLASELGPSVKKRRKNKIVSNVDGFDDSVQISPVIDLTDYKSDDCSTKLIKSLDTNDQLNADSDKSEKIVKNHSNLRNDSKNSESDETEALKPKRPSAKKRRKNKEFSNVDDFDDSIRNVLSDVKDIHSARQIESSDICDQLLVEKSEEVADSDSNLRNDSENTESNKTLDSELRGLSVKKRRKNKVVSSKDDFDASVQTVSFIDLTDHKTDDCSAKRIKSLDTNDQLHVDNESEEVAEDNSNLRNGPTNAESDETQASKSKRHSAKKRRKNEKVLNVDDFVPLVSMNDHSDNKTDDHSARRIKSSNTSDQLPVEKSVEAADDDSNLRNDSENAESNETLASELRGPSVKKRRKNKLDVDDFDNFMQKVTEFNASTDPKAVIEEFEKNKEALLKRYRESFLRNYLESANEYDSRIYCDLNGDELDCKYDADEVNCEKSGVLARAKQAKHLRERALTKAERIVSKARLLKAIQDKSCSHSFTGSNLNDILGYGNEIVSS